MHIPLLAVAYAIFMTLLMLMGTRRSLTAHRPHWFVALGIGHWIVLLSLFVGYWNQQLVQPFGAWAFAMFLCCLIDPAMNIPGLLREINASDLGPEAKHQAKVLSLAVGVAGDFPALWFGGIAAWRAL
jgi:hypothetical protein